MSTNTSLIREFVTNGSETAFAGLVRRYVDLVHSAALRQMAGDTHRAQDVTQAVFTELPRKAPKLVNRACLAGWLYNTARFIGSRIHRSETRRMLRDDRFSPIEESPAEPSTEVIWGEINFFLDEAMRKLHADDREAVVLRYFQGKPLAEIGMVFRLSENAARMRVERALEKLRIHLRRRGINSSASVLGTVLAAHAVSTAPESLASTVLSAALAGTASGGLTASASLSLFPIMTTAQLKIGMTTLALAGAAAGLLLSRNTNQKLRRDLESFRDQAGEIGRLRDENERMGHVIVDYSELAKLRGEHSELLRLRSAVSQLTQKIASTPQPSITPPQENTVNEAVRKEQQRELNKTLGLAKMTLAKFWGAAFLAFAQANQGKMPEDLFAAKEYVPVLPEEINNLIGLASASDFEIVFRGVLTEIKNPARTILMREKEPFDFQDDGGASRTYLFADGHTEIHRAANRDFRAWEQERGYTPQNGAP